MTELNDTQDWDIKAPPEPDTGPETPEQTAARYIAAGLTGEHVNTATGSDGKPVMIAAFRTAGLPPHMADNVKTGATVIAQSIVKAMTTELALVPKAEFAALHEAQQVAAGVTPRAITFRCAHNSPIVVVPGNRPDVSLNAAQLRALAAGAPECSQCQETANA